MRPKRWRVRKWTIGWAVVSPWGHVYGGYDTWDEAFREAERLAP